MAHFIRWTTDGRAYVVERGECRRFKLISERQVRESGVMVLFEEKTMEYRTYRVREWIAPFEVRATLES